MVLVFLEMERRSSSEFCREGETAESLKAERTVADTEQGEEGRDG